MSFATLARIASTLLSSGAVALLAGCITTPQDYANTYAAQIPPTVTQKALIFTYVRATFRDPYSMRDVEISNFIVGRGTSHGLICLWANAKNGFGAYTGRQFTGFYFNPEGLIIGAVSEDQDAIRWRCSPERMKYQPFPALEGK